LIVVGQVTAVLIFVCMIVRRELSPNPDVPPPRLRFSLKELLLATSLAGAAMGIVALLVMQKLDDMSLLFGSSVAATALVLAACFIVIGSSMRIVKLAVSIGAVAMATAIWQFSTWHDLWQKYGGGQDTLPRYLLVSATVLVAVTAGIATIFVRRAVVSRPWVLWAARGLTLLVILITLPIGAYLYYRLAVYDRPPHVELPAPNGHDFFVRAGNELLAVNIPHPETDPAEAFATFVEKHGSSLEIARQGLAIPSMTLLSYTLDDITKYPNRGTAARQVARGLCAEARAHAEAEDYPASAQSCVDCVQFSIDWVRGGRLIESLVGGACESIGVEHLKEIRPHLDAATCRTTSSQLAKIDRSREAFDEFAKRDRIWSQCAMGWRGRLELARDDLLYGEWNGFWSVQSIKRLGGRHVANLRLLIAELAVQAYRLEHDAPPRSLDVLVPNYLVEVPIDPFSGAPLRYRVGGPEPLIYSVGPDGDDDGGRGLSREAFFLESDGDMILDFPEWDADSAAGSVGAGDE
jgi:hypothetical protein